MFKLQKNSKSVPLLKIQSVLGTDTEVQGALNCHGSLRIDGRVEGNVTAEAVTVGEGGVIQGDIAAQTVVVGGKITGNVMAQNIDMKSTSQVSGDLKTKHLSIAEGAVFQGHCSISLRRASSNCSGVMCRE